MKNVESLMPCVVFLQKYRRFDLAVARLCRRGAKDSARGKRLSLHHPAKLPMIPNVDHPRAVYTMVGPAAIENSHTASSNTMLSHSDSGGP